MNPLTPTPEQQALIDRMASEWTGGALSAADLGTGKTLMLVETAKKRGAERVLILGPLHTRYGWEDTVRSQTGEELQWVHNNRKAGKEAKTRLFAGEPGWYFCGREFSRTLDWTKVPSIDFVGVDEIHFASNRQSKSFKKMRELRKRAKFIVGQSATWFGSTFEGAWAVSRILWDHDDIVPPFRFWRGYFCETEFTPFGYDKTKVVGEKNPGEFAQSLPCYVDLEAKHGADPVYIPIHVDLSPEQRKLYTSMEEAGIAWLEDNPVVEELPITQRIRLRQITLGEPILNDEGKVDFAEDCRSTKLDALEELLGDLVGEKALIVTDSEKFAQVAAKRVGGRAWTGNTSDAERKQLIQDFAHGDLRLIVATQPSIAEGTDGLQHGARVLIELSAHDRSILNEQVVGRLHRRGQKRQVVVYQIRARETYDDPQAETLLQRTIAARKSMLKKLDSRGDVQ